MIKPSVKCCSNPTDTYKHTHIHIHTYIYTYRNLPPTPTSPQSPVHTRDVSKGGEAPEGAAERGLSGAEDGM